jgi:hypothetical protein
MRGGGVALAPGCQAVMGTTSCADAKVWRVPWDYLGPVAAADRSGFGSGP